MKKFIVVIVALFNFLGIQMLFADTTPNHFKFIKQTNVNLNTVVTSNTITISGIDTATPISIVGGEYSINGGPYTGAGGTVNNTDTVTLQQTSSANFSTTTIATLTIGGVKGTFSVKTLPADTKPDVFTFIPQTGVPFNTVVTSNTITVSGINTAAPISIHGCTYSINGGAYTSAPGTVNDGDTVTVRQTSAGSYNKKTTVTLTIGKGKGKFSVTTLLHSGKLPLKVFVTSATGNANLGGWSLILGSGKTGLDAGDAICQASATAAGLKGTYKAWLSDDTDEAYCRVQNLTGKKSANCGQTTLPVSAGPWVRTDGYPFAGTIDKLLKYDGQVYTPVRYDEKGVLVTDLYFTATNTDGILGTATPCSNWIDGTTHALVNVGNTEGTTDYWTGATWYYCDNTWRLLCFQTGTGGPLPKIVAPTTAKKVFVTSVTGKGKLTDTASWPDYSGSATGAAAGDIICQARATAAGLLGTYKAWLSDGSIDAKDRITSDGPWYRLDGVKVADNKAALINTATTSLFTAITLDEAGIYHANSAVWTGTDIDGTNIAGHNCNNWGSNLNTDHGRSGRPSLSDGTWTNSYYDVTCDLAISGLYCFEDD